MEYLRLRTTDMLSQPFVWKLVEAVAAPLVDRQTLSGRQFREVCQRVTDDELRSTLERWKRQRGEGTTGGAR